MQPNIKFIHINPIVWLKYFCQATFIVAPILLYFMGEATQENMVQVVMASMWLYLAVAIGTIMTGWSIIRQSIPPFKIPFPSEWSIVSILSIPFMLATGHVFAAVLVGVQLLYSIHAWSKCRNKPSPEELSKGQGGLPPKIKEQIEDVLKDVLGESAKNIKKMSEVKEKSSCSHLHVFKDANGVEHLSHDIAIMFELASTLGKMVAIMDDDDSATFVESFIGANALENWVVTLMHEVSKKWVAGEIDPKKQRHFMRKYMEEKITTRVRETNEKKKEKSNG